MTLQDMRVLVVDDSENLRTLVRAFLRGFGIRQIDEASSGLNFRPELAGATVFGGLFTLI